MRESTPRSPQTDTKPTEFSKTNPSHIERIKYKRPMPKVVFPIALIFHGSIQQCIPIIPPPHFSVYRFELSSLTNLPTTLYLLLKNVNQSSKTFFSWSVRSSQSDLQSSGFSEDNAKARLASLPVKTAEIFFVLELNFSKGMLQGLKEHPCFPLRCLNAKERS
jgi:hypothetical protein